MKKFIVLFFFVAATAQAADLDWSGLYRVEGNLIRNTRLGGGGDKEYVLHHLILRPKIVAADGITIYGRFDLLNAAGYPNSAVGQFFGDGVGSPDPANHVGISHNADDSSVLSRNEASDQFQITNLYMNYTHEYGSLLVGRVALHFGLGMTFNAGDGLFDHWLTTRDMVAYKVMFGNIFVMPMIGRANQGSLGYNEHTNDYIIQAQYDNPETNLSMGVIYQMRMANGDANDAPVGQSPIGLPRSANDPNAVLGGPVNVTPAYTMGDFNQQTLNVFVLKEAEHFRFGIEGSLLTGQSGVTDVNGNGVSFSGIGVATETEWRPAESKWRTGLKAGYASGDSPKSTEKFEGYAFHRNYDVAFLMFNYPLGQRDFLRSYLYGGGPGANSDSLDTEAISNAYYFAPYISYQLNDSFDFGLVGATGLLDQVPLANANETDRKDLGYEFDLSFNYKQKGGIYWSNTVGLLFPGGAFQGDASYGTNFCFGVQSKAAVRF